MNQNENKSIPDRVQVAVIGGGVGGLSASFFLGAKGYDVHVFERTTHEKFVRQTQVGNGVKLLSHCVRMLVNGGLDITPYITPMEIEIRDEHGLKYGDVSRSRQLYLCPRLKSIKASAYSISRQHLMKLLVDKVATNRLHLEKQCQGLVIPNDDDDDDTVQLQFKDGTSITAELVVAADGIRSVLAEQLFGVRPLNSRATVVMQGYSTYTDLGPTSTWLLHSDGGSIGLNPMMLSKDQPGSFWWLSGPFDSQTQKMGNMERVRHVSKKYSWAAVTQVMDNTLEDSVQEWVARDVEPLKKFYLGRIAFLGDACHAPYPTAEYGIGMALEDSYWLADKLSSSPNVMQNAAMLQHSLDQYEKKRAHYTANIVYEARKLMFAFHSENAFWKSVLRVFWKSGIGGQIVSRQFVKRYETGIDEIPWKADEVADGNLAF